MAIRENAEGVNSERSVEAVGPEPMKASEIIWQRSLTVSMNQFESFLSLRVGLTYKFIATIFILTMMGAFVFGYLLKSEEFRKDISSIALGFFSAGALFIFLFIRFFLFPIKRLATSAEENIEALNDARISAQRRLEDLHPPRGNSR